MPDAAIQLGLKRGFFLAFFLQIGYYSRMNTSEQTEGVFAFPDPKTTDPKKRRVQRALEMVPGLLSWGTLLGMFIVSFLLPL